MLSSLPTELVRDIIEAAVPQTFRSTTYKERQRILCSLSLVSRLFRSIAQPLLLEIVWVKSVRQLEILPSSIDDGGGGDARNNKRIEAAVITLNWDILLLAKNVKTGFRKFEHIENMTLSGIYESHVDMSLISSFQSMTDLSSLHLSHCKASITTSVTLPNLRSLTLFQVDAKTTAALLDPVSLPRLKELCRFDLSAKIKYAIALPSFQRLLPQLEVILFRLHAWRELTDTHVRLVASRTLVDCAYHHLPNLPKCIRHPVYLRAHGLTSFDKDNRCTTFSQETVELTSYIKSHPSLPLRTLYLTCADPSTVRLSSTSQGYVEDLFRVCRERKIELIFETGPSDSSIDPCFSPNFSRKMKEQRRKETVEEGLGRMHKG